ncbi:MAG: YqaE/Pmp3 family membrane protein [Desulfobacter sp.]|nr:YqaE/Pmp3 family membrane protein [Desulfobacter sp.]WDP87143.1 MAG: YqaE/Pmp3 family membrane protein [Desulfobacter sp.]
MKDIIKIICAIILPPVAAFLQVGIGKHFWLNIVLTILGGIPGMVHAIWLIVKNNRTRG